MQYVNFLKYFTSSLPIPCPDLSKFNKTFTRSFYIIFEILKPLNKEDHLRTVVPSFSPPTIPKPASNPTANGVVS